MLETLKNVALSLLMGIGTVVAIVAGLVLFLVGICGLVIATKTHTIITIACLFVVFSAYFAVAYYNEKFK